MPLSSKSNELLMSYVIAYRMFGLDKSSAMQAMQILMERKMKAPDLNFEDIIEQKIAQMPKFELDLMKPFSILNFNEKSR